LRVGFDEGFGFGKFTDTVFGGNFPGGFIADEDAMVGVANDVAAGCVKLGVVKEPPQ